MSEDHNLSEENKSNEELSNAEEQVSQEITDATEELNTDSSEEVVAESSDVFDEQTDEEEDSLEVSEDAEGDVFGTDASEEEELEMIEESSVDEPAQPAVASAPIKKKVEDTKKWYSLRVISGKERKIRGQNSAEKCIFATTFLLLFPDWNFHTCLKDVVPR